MFSKQEKIETYQKIWGRMPIIGEQITFGKSLIEAKKIEDGVIYWEEVTWDELLSDKAQDFLSGRPKHYFSIDGIHYYHPPSGEYLAYISKEKKLKKSTEHKVPR